MSTFGLWKSVEMAKLLLFFVSFMVLNFNNMILWIVLGLVILLGACYLTFRQGQMSGHESCAISKTIANAEATGKLHTLDPKMLKKAWSRSNGVKSVFAGALIAYVINAVYIVVMMTGVEGTPLYISRVASWVVTMGFWPLIATWYESYTVMNGWVAAVLMISPFVLPLCQYAGYMCGPKLWAKTEKAMAEGKRRAKARSRINRRKKAPKVRGPEI